jgi:uncharacterized protein (DUF2141 family)
LKRLSWLIIAVLLFTLSQCAKKGRPSGGPKDEDPPLFVVAEPAYESINFDSDEIKLYFNEYIKLNDLNKQLIISPPLSPDNPPLITPQGSASKFITIKILDTLKDDTTYIFDFGNSVEDNNESNKLERFKYVFSTGDYIDSLTLKGSVKNSFISDNIKNIKLLLYRLDSSYTDSAVYKTKPNYVTSSLDTSNFRFTNLRKGNYFLMALKDASSDYLFSPEQDEIGFYRDTIVLPRDTVVVGDISLFKEVLPYKFRRGKEERKGKLIFSYEGDAKGMQLELMSDVPEDFKTVSFFEKGADTLNLWHSPIERDSLIFKVIRGNVIDTSVVKLRKKKLDSLIVSSTTRSYLEFNDTLFLDASNPIVKIDTSKVSFVDKDTVNVDFDLFISEKESRVGLLFEKKHEQTYRFEVYPEALTDIFNQTNDSLKYRFSTRKLEDYGDIQLSIQNPASRPVIIQITDVKDKTIRQQIVKKTSTISFKYLKAREYKIRIIYDDNDNGKWDTGDFLKRIQPEAVEYFPEAQAVRPNWSLNEVITIKQ